MKRLFSLLLILLISFTPTFSYGFHKTASFENVEVFSKQPRKKTVRVKSYTKKNGTNVKSYMRSKPRKK